MTHSAERSKLPRPSTLRGHIRPPHHLIEYSHPETVIPILLLPTRSKCSGHPSSRARAQLPLPVTSPLLLCACQQAPLVLAHQGLLDPPAVMPSPSARPLARSFTSVKKRKPSFWPSRQSCSSRGSTWKILTSTLMTLSGNLRPLARASRSKRWSALTDEQHGQPMRNVTYEK
ncbi:hypothetical protein GMOD_00001217 [Pyrenophora seminiperda CCB06]|uniref:Uncharacterized protein n=1 Tax=Pyrenophora seminiperda CCB06 TaxID=1302712 RepID=A0A3M7LYH9_9PLEO|nr:hypothetical protein GMOD_00001217 [Pyrenophora seminiperda CCB06]